MLALFACFLLVGTVCADPFTTTERTVNATLAMMKAQREFPELKKEFSEFCFYRSQNMWTPHSEAANAVCLLDTFDKWRSTVYRPGTAILDEEYARKRWFCNDPQFDSSRDGIRRCLGQLTLPDRTVDEQIRSDVFTMWSECQSIMTGLCDRSSLGEILSIQIQARAEAKAELDQMKAQMQSEMQANVKSLTDQLKRDIEASTAAVQKHNTDTIDMAHRIKTVNADALMHERLVVVVFDACFVKLMSMTPLGDALRLSCSTKPSVMATTGLAIAAFWSVFAYFEWCLMVVVRRFIVSFSPEALVAMSLENIAMHFVAAFVLRGAVIWLELWFSRRVVVTHNHIHIGGGAPGGPVPATTTSGRAYDSDLAQKKRLAVQAALRGRRYDDDN